MLISRGLTTLRALKNLKIAPVHQSVRNSGHSVNYRKGAPEASRTVIWAAEGVQGFMWWWILWHLWTEPDHILGEFPYPDPSKWTDEELGIQK
ncbi:NADH dehydrogenase [ubiquinone] 1 beta subcomplex subunit 2, mitochondrial [Diabrotica virgifera virgifera]|uniref:NADH dehydrogenase [ubiquinone] 1 beta subcomplex subunit 2, mitochondrial-like n=1 Tax=Diabrotica virgifera virgifera TaxID=50390 RepID=A0A6P7FMD0_DIAVI|nr:NADH dehydrogenase [ubiquinone] 1 beta subcomplex subunit 2, mitochondrial [Diabrotica virgifera virgifera]